MVKLTVFVTGVGAYAAVHKVPGEYINGLYPAGAMVEVSAWSSRT